MVIYPLLIFFDKKQSEVASDFIIQYPKQSTLTHFL
jgi:hypothetical protein